MPEHAPPQQAEADGTINLETKPRQVKAWLDRLPLTEPVVCALELLKFLAACNRTDLPDHRRQQLLDLIEPVLLRVRESLRAMYLDAPLPMDARNQSQADMAGALLTEAAEAYRLLIQVHLEPHFRLFGNDPLPDLLRGRLGQLRNLLIHHYETHAAVPEGLWLDLHQTYSLALKLGYADSPPENQGPSATDLYRAALLLAVADPYRMPRYELPWVLDLIDQRGMLATLVPATATRVRPGAFAIDNKSDAPPFALARDDDPLLQAWSLSLNTGEPVKFLTWLINYLDSPKSALDTDLEPVLRNPRYPSFLERLRRQWSASQQRLSTRRPTEQPLDYQLRAGFASLVAGLVTAGGAQPADASDLAICQAINLSAGGMTLTKEGALGTAIRVGELVGVRQTRQDAWQVGVVRWLRSPEQGEIAFGVQLLAPYAQVTELLTHQATSGPKALLLTTQRGTPETGLLVTQPGDLPAGGTGRILIGDQIRGLKIEKRVEVTSGLASCRVRLIG